MGLEYKKKTLWMNGMPNKLEGGRRRGRAGRSLQYTYGANPKDIDTCQGGDESHSASEGSGSRCMDGGMVTTHSS